MKQWQQNLAASLWTSTAGQAENTCRAAKDKLPPERWKENNKRRGGETEKMDFMLNILSDLVDCPIFLPDYFLFCGFSVRMCVSGRAHDLKMSDYPITAMIFLQKIMEKWDCGSWETHCSLRKMPDILAGPSEAKVGRHNFHIKTWNFSKVNLDANAGAKLVHYALTSERVSTWDWRRCCFALNNKAQSALAPNADKRIDWWTESMLDMTFYWAVVSHEHNSSSRTQFRAKMLQNTYRLKEANWASNC